MYIPTMLQELRKHILSEHRDRQTSWSIYELQY